MQVHADEPLSEAGVSTLVSGIIQDARHLLVEQLTLFQVEIKNEIERTLRSAVVMAAGAVLLIPGLVLFGFAIAYGICALFPEMPLWGSFGIVGICVSAIGIGLIVGGAQMFQSLKAGPDTALKSLKENIQWKTKK